MVNAALAPFDPTVASDTDLADCYDAATSAYALDFPKSKLPTLEVYTAGLRQSTSLFGPQQFWIARVDGRIRGLATLVLPVNENRHLAITKIQVAPAYRRGGIGTALLRATLPETRAAGRTRVTGQAVKIGSAGELWAHALGFASVNRFIGQTLHIPDTDRSRWTVPVPSGFRLESWIGAAPEALVARYAQARTAISDAPMGESTFSFAEWSAERVRTHEASARERERELRVVVAVDEASGDVAGFTEIELNAARPEHALQMETAVSPAYRGNGLGRLIKAHMMRWLTEELPAIERVTTGNAADNEHMVRINAELGYVVDVEITDVEIGTGALL